ncbi:MAG: EAL domain-containing protein [Candidatus Dormiibacterota bacterium]
MGSSRQLPDPHKSGGRVSIDRTSHQSVAPRGRAPQTPAPAHDSLTPTLAVSPAPNGIKATQTKDAVLLANGKTRRITDVNATVLLLTGYERSELIGAPISKLVAPADRKAQRNRTVAAAHGPTLISQARYRHKDGSPIHVEIEQRLLEDGRILGILRSAIQRDPDQREISQMLTRFDMFVATVGPNARISFGNPALCALTGWSASELIGMPAHELFPLATPPAPNRPLLEAMLAGDLGHPITTDLVTRSGNRRPVVVSTILMSDGDGTTLGAAVFGQDMTQERAAHSELEVQLQQREGVAAAIARLQPGESTEATAQAICGELRGLNGVDFAVVVVFTAEGSATVLALDAPRSLPVSAGQELPATRSAYLIERSEMGPWVERWHQRAEDGAYGEAMTRANVQAASYAPIRYGHDTLGVLLVGSLHSDSVLIESLPAIAEFGSTASSLLALDLKAERLHTERRITLQAIIDTTAFHPVFQPIVDVSTRQVVGYEALTRFADGEPPDARFSTAWSVGLGMELEFATLERAIRVARALPTDQWLNVNVSPKLLNHPRALQTLMNSADRPLVLEITEHEVISDYREVREALQLLRPARVAVDDAGAGIANFGHIVELRPDFIKVDVGLVRGVDIDPARQAMIVALSHFARVTGSQLISEGVETGGEARTLKSLGGVDFAQGYWYGRPREVGAFTETPTDPAAATIH